MCPKCRGERTGVVSIEITNGEIRRERQCLSCGIKFETVERSVMADTVNNFRAQMRGITK